MIDKIMLFSDDFRIGSNSPIVIKNLKKFNAKNDLEKTENEKVLFKTTDNKFQYGNIAELKTENFFLKIFNKESLKLNLFQPENNLEDMTEKDLNLKLNQLEKELKEIGIRINSSGLKPGIYKGAIEIIPDNPNVEKVCIELTLNVLFSLSYTIEKNELYLSPRNVDNIKLNLKNIAKRDLVLQGKLTSSHSWISFSENTFSLPTDGEKTIDCIIKAPGLRFDKSRDYDCNIMITYSLDNQSFEEVNIPLIIKVSNYKPSLEYQISSNKYICYPEKSKTIELFIFNQGEVGSYLDIELKCSKDWISFLQKDYIIKYDEKLSVPLVFNDRKNMKQGVYECQITIQSNDPNNKKEIINLLFEVIPDTCTVTLQISNSVAYIKKASKDEIIRINLDVAPCIKNGRTLVPLRFISDVSGAKIEYIVQQDNEIRVRYKDIYVRLWLQRKGYRQYDALVQIADEEPVKVYLDAPPMIIDGRTMVPLRFIADAFGAKIDWDSNAQTITLNIEIDYRD